MESLGGNPVANDADALPTNALTLSRLSDSAPVAVTVTLYLAVRRSHAFLCFG